MSIQKDGLNETVLLRVTGHLSVSHSLKKGQGAGQKKGTFDA